MSIWSVSYTHLDVYKRQEAVCTATRKIIEDIPPENVLGISFSSQMQACIAVNENGEALRPAMIWADQRAEEQMEQLVEMCIRDRNTEEPERL